MTITASEVTQIRLALDNRPGILADLCAHLAEHRVNVRAMTAEGGAAAGEIRLVVDHADRAVAALEEAGIGTTTGTCLAIEMPNRPGAMARVAHALAVAGVNIEAIYGSATPRTGTALLILDVSDLARALAIEWR